MSPLQSRAAARAMAAAPGRPRAAAMTRRTTVRTRMRVEKFRGIVYMYPATRMSLAIHQTWHLCRLSDYNEKLKRDSGTPSTLPEPPPPPSPKARPPEKGFGKSQPSSWSSSRRGDRY
eukprot:2653275-Pyramimonas_sp.AAC.1